MTVTAEILRRTKRISPEPEITPGFQNYQMFNTGGVEVEVGEFLYSLVRLTKPSSILETGTHLGISSLYLALGCQDNKKGRIFTYEVIPELRNQASLLWRDLGVQELITSNLTPSLSADLKSLGTVDLLFLDSEPQFRFDEFVYFWDTLIPGGVILIHDLHPSLGHHDQVFHGVYDWPYGDFREKIGSYIKEHKVQCLSFSTPRGLTIFQKEAAHFELTSYLRKK